MMQELKIIYSTCLLQMRKSFARPMFRYCILVDPIIFALITYMMFKGTGQNNFFAYVVLGTGMSSLWNAICFSSAGDIERERFTGTLEIIASVPASFKTIVFGKIIGNTILGTASLGITFIFIRLAFNAPMTIENPLLFLFSLLISLISFMGLSMMIAALITLSRNTRALMNCIGFPVIILSGMLFPIDVLPLWTRPLSYMLSPSWAVKLMRMCVFGVADKELFFHQLLILTAITLVYFMFSYYLFERIDRRIRFSATLGVQ